MLKKNNIIKKLNINNKTINYLDFQKLFKKQNEENIHNFLHHSLEFFLECKNIDKNIIVFILNTACKLNYVDILKLFTKNPVNISNYKRNRFLHTAILNDNFDSLSFLLKNEKLFEELDSFSFIMACQKGNLNIIKLLANDKRIDITMSKNFGIGSLIANNNFIAADYLFSFPEVKDTLKKDKLDSYNILFQRFLEKNIKSF